MGFTFKERRGSLKVGVCTKTKEKCEIGERARKADIGNSRYNV